jgi:hypothetical protein
MEPIVRNAKKINPITCEDQPIEIKVEKIKIEKGAKTETGRYWTVTLSQAITGGSRSQEQTAEYPDEHKFDECITGYDIETGEPIIDNAILAQKLAPFGIIIN